MKKEMTIFYEVHNGLYVNITNKCPCACTFCLRQTMDTVGNSGRLWLDHEPSIAEIEAALAKIDLSKYTEIVFCGFGEPTERLDVLCRVARLIKEKCNAPIRINTNGLGNLVNKRSIAGEFKGLIDSISISLNTPNPDDYFKLVRPKFGRESFDEMLKFAKECTNFIPNVILTTVATTISEDEEVECLKICEKLGVKYRIRPWED